LFFGLLIYRNPQVFNPWVSNFIPDGLWAFSFSSCLFVIQEDLKIALNITIVVVLGGCLEVLQWLSWVEGTFDYADLLVYFLFSCIAILFNRFIAKNQSRG